MDVGPLKKDVCKTKNKHLKLKINIKERDFKRNKQFLIKIYNYDWGKSKSIYSDTTVEVC